MLSSWGQCEHATTECSIYILKMAWSHHSSILQSLCSPNEDFASRNNRAFVHFLCVLQRVVAQREYSRPCKGPRKDTTDLLLRLAKSSFGEHKVAHFVVAYRPACDFATDTSACDWIGRTGSYMFEGLCFPNDDFRMSKHIWARPFVSTFHRLHETTVLGKGLFVLARYPCGKQRFREITRPDWVGTLRRCNPTPQYVRFVKWPTQSGLAISRKRCFPHGQILPRLCLPNEDVGKRNKRCNADFRGLFKGEYTSMSTKD